MTPIKTYIADSLVGKRLHFKCDCLFNIDEIGTINSYEIVDGEIIWKVDTDKGRTISIGENHPNMNVEEV